MGLSIESPLAVAVNAGCTALPALLNIKQASILLEYLYFTTDIILSLNFQASHQHFTKSETLARLRTKLI